MLAAFRMQSSAPEAISLAVKVLEEWGVEAEARPAPPTGGEYLGPEALDLRRYEMGNPKATGAL